MATIPTALDVSDETHLRVLEVYPAVQGEGSLIGVPSTFVRLAGCTVGCRWCDTKYSWKAAQGTDFLPEDLVRQTRLLTTHNHVVLTGGEPLEHPTELVIEFLRRLPAFYHVTIETSGTGHEQWDTETSVGFFPSMDLLWSVSPKLGSAQATKPFPNLMKWSRVVKKMGHRLQFKFVIGSEDDFESAVDACEPLWSTLQDRSHFEIVLQTATDITLHDDTWVSEQIISSLRSLQEKVVHDRTFTRLSDLGVLVRVLPQLHAILYGKKRGV